MNYAHVISLNYAPIVLKSQELKVQIDPDIYQNIKFCFNGDLSLRDIGFYLQKDIINFASSLIKFINNKSIKLIPIDDFSSNIFADNNRIFFDDFSSRQLNPLICYIDSNKKNLILMKKILLNTGYHFKGIDNALRAIPQLINSQPDMIFLDAKMPLINGFELCLMIKRMSQFQNIPIIVMTEKNEIVDKARAYYAGASEFMTKPITKTELLHSIANHLQNKLVANNKVPVTIPVNLR